MPDGLRFQDFELEQAQKYREGKRTVKKRNE
jgi:hypothetical protein